jgi:oligopeptide transport system substrate-binding protein
VTSNVLLFNAFTPTFEVTLKEPTPFFLGLLSHYSTWPVHKPTVMKHGTMDDRNGQWTRPGNFVCNGPFNLKTWELNKKIVVDKNPLYWDADIVELNEIHFYPIDNMVTEERMFRAGQLHVTSSLPPDKIATYKEIDDSLMRISPYLDTYFYRINVDVPHLQDPRIRRALAMAIDRVNLVEKITKGGQIPAYAMTPPGTMGYSILVLHG